MEPVGISDGFSWMRTFCQSVNFELSIWSCQAMRFPQVGFGHRLGWGDGTHSVMERVGGIDAAHLGVFELLLDVCD